MLLLLRQIASRILTNSGSMYFFMKHNVTSDVGLSRSQDVRRNWLQHSVHLNILMLAHNYVNEAATRCKGFIAAFLLQHLLQTSARAAIIAAFILLQTTDRQTDGQ